jgi:hypothetical protein
MSSSSSSSKSQISQPKPFAELGELPDKFQYPESYKAYVQRHPRVMHGLQPWGYVDDPGSYTERYSPICGNEFVVFAKAYLEDQLAGFEVTDGIASGRVLVINPWQRPEPLVLARCDDFDNWLSWAREQLQERFE